MLIFRRVTIVALLGIGLLAGLAIPQLIFINKAKAIGINYWDDSSTDCDLAQSQCDNREIQSVVGDTQFVHRTGVYVRAYFKSPKNAEVTVYGANFCPGYIANPTTTHNYDEIQKNDYYFTHPNELKSNTEVTDFYAFSGSNFADVKSGKYYSSNSNGTPAACVNNKLVLKAPYGLDLAQDNDIVGRDLYYMDILVTPSCGLVGWSWCNPDENNTFSGIQNSFYMRITGGDGYAIAQNPTDELNNQDLVNAKTKNIAQILGADGTMNRVLWPKNGNGNDPKNYTDFIIKFGADCKVPASGVPLKLYVYDFDGLGGDGAQPLDHPIRMDISIFDENGKRVLKNKILNVKNQDNSGQLIDITGNFDNSNKPIKVYPGYRFEWHIDNVYYNNTIQFSIPYSSIYYNNTPDNPLCLNKTYTYPNTTLDNGNISISAANGSSHTFRHYVDVDKFAPNHGGTVNWKVQTKTNNGAWTDTGRGGTEKIEKDQVDNADALVNTGPYTAPATGEGQYCEQLVLSNPQKPDDVGLRYTTSQALCVNYGSGGPGPGNLPVKTVEFKTQGGGGEVKDEPEVTVDVDGSSLSGTLGVKPNTNEMGYQNQSKKIDPKPVNETEHKIPTNFIEQKTVPEDYPAVCIPLTKQDSNGNWVPYPDGRCSNVYTCPNGGSLSGTTCLKSHEEYSYYCDVPNVGKVFTGWVRSDPGNCGYSNYDSCPDGTPVRLGQPSNSARACNDAWTCAYGKLWTNVGKPYCEFRCDGGIGNKAILAESRITTNTKGTGFETWGNGDTNCYKPWQVTVSCQITYTSTGGTWIPSGSRRVVNGTVQTWPETITTDERGNMASYCNNPPGGYWASQYEYGRVGSQGCMALSLVSISIFTDTPPSPLSPNNRQVKTVYWNRAVVGGAATKCWTSVGRPYAQFNNTDISTMTCGTGAGNIKMYAMDEYGSSVEYAAYAAGTINSLRTNYNNGSQGLAFASDGSKMIGGGQFASKSGGDCNYYDSLVNTNGTYAASHIKVYPSDITIDQNFVNSVVTTTGSYAIFAPNITVNGSISLPFNLSNNASNPNETGAKVLYLIAKNNININSNATNIDAMLISNKNINTCNGSPNQCENNLVINGGLAAGTVQFKRTGKSSLNCARPGHGSVCNEYQYPAEVVNYGAYYELFLPPFKPVSGLDQGRYDSIKSVAPIF